jgi:hypothetical protein
VAPGVAALAAAPGVAVLLTTAEEVDGMTEDTEEGGAEPAT